MKFSSQQYFNIFGILLLQLILIAAIGFFLKSIYNEFRANNTKNQATEILSKEIIYYDEVLSMSAYMATLTGEVEWQDRYNEFLPLLDDTLTRAMESVPEINRALKQTHLANTKLVRMEKQALEMTQSDRTDEAVSLLQSDAYEREKQSYSRGIEQAIDMLAESRSRNLVRFETRLNELLIMILLLTVLFLIATGLLIKVFIDISKKFRILSITDDLTGLYNRRYFNDIFPLEIQRSKRHGYILVFAMIDLDNFKKYNDIYGHQQGDTVLASVGKILHRKMRRADDIAFRLGGEEFGIIFATKTEKMTRVFMEILRKAIEDSNIEHKGNEPHKVLTVSIGVRMLRPEEKAPKEYDAAVHYHDADQALYQAKSGGRNRIEVYAPAETPSQ